MKLADAMTSMICMMTGLRFFERSREALEKTGGPVARAARGPYRSGCE
jgi:hypothetical protein